MRDLSKGGKIQIIAEEVAGCRETVFLTFEAKKLDNLDTFSKSDPFLEISRANENWEFSLVHRTEVVDNNLSPTWRPFEKNVSGLCNGDYDRSLKIEVFDDDDGGDHDLIGTCQTNLRTLVKGPGSDNVYNLINQKKKEKKGSKYKTLELCFSSRSELRATRPSWITCRYFWYFFTFGTFGLPAGRPPGQLHRRHRLHRLQRESFQPGLPPLQRPKRATQPVCDSNQGSG